MKLYIAASMAEIDEARKIRIRIEQHGIRVTSRWLNVNESSDPFDNPSLCHEKAMNDLEDIDMSDAVLFLRGTKISPGKNTELGYALANKKVVFFVGEPNSVFHFHRTIILFKDLESAINSLVQSRRIIEAYA